MAETITIITQEDLGTTLNTTNNKVNVSISQEAGNKLTLESDGLYVATPQVGTMAAEDKDDYLTEDEINTTYAKKQDVPTKTSDLINDEGYIKSSDLDADKFLQNAELLADGKTLRLTLSDDSVVDVNLEDLLPIKQGAGLIGDGTTATPVRIDETVVALKSELGTIASESKSDYYTKTNTDDTFTKKTDFTVTLKRLDGSTIGKALEV